MRYLGIDIGGTQIKYGVYNEKGENFDNGIVDSVRDDLSKIIEILKNIIDLYPDIDGIGLSIPGAVDTKKEIIIEGGACKVLKNIKLSKILQEYAHVPVAMENDANCATLAENWLGNGKNCQNFICITLGTGVGGGIIINNSLYSGSHFNAGEFGYMKNDINEILSTFGSTESLVKKVQTINSNINNGKMTFEMLEQDKKVYDVYKKWIKNLSRYIYNIGTCFDPDKILIGGGISAQKRVIEDIQKEIIEMEDYPIGWNITNCLFNNHSGKIGAVYYLIQLNMEE